jgi:CRISPR-associated protein Csn2
MKLVYSEWEQSIQLKENCVNILCIENPLYFSKIIGEIKSQVEGKEGGFVLSDEKILDLKNHAGLILSPFLIDFHSKKLLNALYKELNQIASDEEVMSTNQIKSEILSYIARLSDYLDYDLEIPEDFDILELFKISGIKFDADDQSLCSSFLNYLVLCHRILKWDVIFTVGLKTFFSKAQLSLLYENVFQNKIHLILLENNNPYLLSGEQVITIDNDLCEI